MITSFQAYSDFFEQVTKSKPYPCQVAYAQTDSDFVTLRFPTGVGKTLTVLVSWLYRQQQRKAPTRLVIIEPMRVLVGQVAEEARRTVQNSGLDISVHVLMGGAIDNEWITQPEKPCVIVGTQDQILSRQLNRGYACSRWSWPQHFALLNNDCEFFVDECQLMGPGYSTTVELSHWRKELGMAGDCRVIWSSATLDVAPLQPRNIQATEINLTDKDYSHPDLSRKVSRTKALHKLSIALKSYAENLARYVVEKHQARTLSLVIVNQVSRAIAVFEALQDSGIPIRLLHSRFRGIERETLLDGLKDYRGIVVSTQVVEAGVDLDSRILFTEVADWASLVQRFGRCGRNDTYDAADIYWIDCQGYPDAHLLPYLREDCGVSQQILEALDNGSIQSLLQVEPPSQNIRSTTLDRDDLIELFDNHPGLDGRDIDVSEMIRSRGLPTIQVGWVDNPPNSDWYPSEQELCPVPKDKLIQLSKEAYVWDDYSGEKWKLGIPKLGSPAILLRTWGGYSESLGFTGNSKHIPPLLSLMSQENQKTGWDSLSYQQATQKQHGEGQAEEMARIRKHLSHIDLPDWLDEVAAWSDLGKSHPVWQKSATGEERPTVLMAKSTHLRHHSRRGFRHELASGLALLQLGKPFCYAYLVSAHHGKCRCRFVSWDWESEGFIKGIKSGDKIPATDLGRMQSPDLILTFPDRMTWEQGVRKLLKDLGPFKLVYLETLIRAADIADSKKYMRGSEGVKSE